MANWKLSIYFLNHHQNPNLWWKRNWNTSLLPLSHFWKVPESIYLQWDLSVHLNNSQVSKYARSGFLVQDDYWDVSDIPLKANYPTNIPNECLRIRRRIANATRISLRKSRYRLEEEVVNNVNCWMCKKERWPVRLRPSGYPVKVNLKIIIK